MAVSTITLGTASEIAVGAAGEVTGGTFAYVRGVFAGSLSIAHTKVDTTHNDGGGWGSGEYGISRATLTFSVRFDPDGDSAGQAVVRTAGLTAKTKKAWLVRPRVGGSEDEFFFDGVIVSVDLVAGDTDAPVNMEVTVESVGVLTWDSAQGDTTPSN